MLQTYQPFFTGPDLCFVFKRLGPGEEHVPHGAETLDEAVVPRQDVDAVPFFVAFPPDFPRKTPKTPGIFNTSKNNQKWF